MSRAGPHYQAPCVFIAGSASQAIHRASKGFRNDSDYLDGDEHLSVSPSKWWPPADAPTGWPNYTSLCCDLSLQSELNIESA